jgi:hypothetical protein
MSQRTETIAPDVEYHRVLAGEKRRIGRGILAIALLIGGMFFFNIVFAVAAAGVDAAVGTEGHAAYTPLMHAAGMASVAMLIPWSMFIQRWLYGLKGASLHSVVSRFRFDVFGRALLLITPALIAVTAFQYWVPLPQTTWTYANVFWFLIATLMLTLAIAARAVALVGVVAVVGLALWLVLAVIGDSVQRGPTGFNELRIWPYAVAPAVAGVLYAFLFAPSIGIVTYVLRRAGITPARDIRFSPWSSLMRRRSYTNAKLSP